jgi:predicted GTPase
VINKVDTARPENVDAVEANVRGLNPRATIIRAASPVTVADPAAIRGKRVLVVEDGPTLTHGEMTFGAAHVAARRYGAASIVDPRPHAVGSIRDTFSRYRHLTDVLPAMGYGARQVSELEQTIRAVDCDLVLVGTPIDLGRLLSIDKPWMRVGYELDERAKRLVGQAVMRALAQYGDSSAIAIG